MRAVFVVALVLAGCDPEPVADTCEMPVTLETGDATGHPDPLAVPSGQARAGVIDAAELPDGPGDLLRWGSGEIVLANEHIAMAIETAGASDLYDPWGGRPTGVALVRDGALMEPADFGEILILVGRHTVMSESVTVMNDGTDGAAAVVRAEGLLRPLPFFQAIVGALYRDDLSDLRGAIDYELQPGMRHVDVYVSIASTRSRPFETGGQIHGFMFTPRMPPFASDFGFDANDADRAVPFLAFADGAGTAFGYEVPEVGMITMGVNVSGFVSRVTPSRRIQPCGVDRYLLARITVGGPGVDGVIEAMAQDRSEATRAITGIVRQSDGTPAEGALVHVLASDSDAYVTRASETGPDGRYTVHVPIGAAGRLDATRPGDARITPISFDAAATSVDVPLPPAGTIEVTVVDELGDPLPARITVLPSSGTTLPERAPDPYGGPVSLSGRLHVAYAHTGAASLRAPAGAWEVIASRGYEYEIARQVATITDGETSTVMLTLPRVVDTTNVLCGDFHIHTRRSNDSPDDPVLKVRSAVAEGLELPVRSDHEYVADFQPIVESLGLTAFARGLGSIEMTSMEIWGHMGVFPLVADETAMNAGAPLWQDYPTPGSPDTPVRTLSPRVVFDRARDRAEAPVIIINHPMGGTNYFGYVGFDPVTATVERTEDWDESFGLVEVFNDSSWRQNRERTVRAWLGLLNHGRRVFAVGSSDSHELPGSPVGFPRTCIELGTDDPRAVTPNQVRDALAAGHATVSGGIYVDATVEGLGPGRDAEGLGTMATVHVRVQAASWVDVDELVLVVDGVDGTPLPILPGDADPMNPVIRYEADLDVPVSATGGYVIVAAYGDAALEPVHPGRIAFGATNPIFLRP